MALGIRSDIKEGWISKQPPEDKVPHLFCSAPATGKDIGEGSLWKCRCGKIWRVTETNKIHGSNREYFLHWKQHTDEHGTVL